MIETEINKSIKWFKACTIDNVPEEGGACVLYNDVQIAVYRFESSGKWYAAQNMCPHKMQMALSRGIIGDKNGEPKVACPFHKKIFSLVTGCNLNGEDYKIKTYPVMIENNFVYIGVE